MSRVVKVGLIQAKWEGNMEAMIQKHEKMIDMAADKGVQILCLQELFFAPYFPAEEDIKWYELAEPIPGPITDRMQKKAEEHSLVLIVPMYEEDMTGVCYNTSVIFDVDGRMLGKYRKNHLPDFITWEKFYFKLGNLGYPVFNTAYGKVGVYICYDRHFPEGARILGLNGAEIVFNPSATTVMTHPKYLWHLEQPAHAVANNYFIAAINRVGVEEPWNIGKFYGSSYICNPKGEIIAEGSEDKDETVIADVELDMIRRERCVSGFYRNRRPETYSKLVEL